MTVSTATNVDRIAMAALAIGLGGGLIAALIAILGKLLSHDFSMIALAVFAGAQVAAIVLGISTRASLIGRAAAFTSGILLVGSMLLLS